MPCYVQLYPAPPINRKRHKPRHVELNCWKVHQERLLLHVRNCISHVATSTCYQFLGAVNNVLVSFWWTLETPSGYFTAANGHLDSVTDTKLQELQSWSTWKLVGAGRTPLTINRSSCVDVEEKRFTTEIVMVNLLTCEAILSLQDQMRWKPRDIAYRVGDIIWHYSKTLQCKNEW